MITGAQIRAARGALGWSVQTLASKSGVGFRTLTRFEQSDGVPPSRTGTLQDVQKCLESAGVQFIGSPDDWPGVRFSAKPRQDKKRDLPAPFGEERPSKSSSS
jgi:transcriptional regulator with XRE-family HTH domain